MSEKNPLNATKYELHYGNRLGELNTRVFYGWNSARDKYHACKTAIKILIKTRGARHPHGELHLVMYRGLKFSTLSEYVTVTAKHANIIDTLKILEESPLGVHLDVITETTGVSRKSVRNHLMHIKDWGVDVQTLGGSRYKINYDYQVLDVVYRMEQYT